MKVIQLWKDKNGRVRKEVLNTLGTVNFSPFSTEIGNFAKASNENLQIVLDSTIVSMLDNNSTHMWNTMSFYWKHIVASPTGDTQASEDSDDSS